MSRASKLAILTAWEKHNKEDEEKFSDAIGRLKTDVVEQETRLSALHEVRQKLEKALRKGEDISNSLESRMRALAKDVNQREIIDLLVKMAYTDAEKMALHSDSALQRLKIRKQESSLLKIHKYEQIADKLINNESDDSQRQQLQQEYRVIKNQLNYQLIPLRQDSPIVSWNSQLLWKNGGRTNLPNALDLQMSNTFMINDFQLEQHQKKKRGSVHLPKIVTPSSMKDRSVITPPETQSDYGTEYPSTMIKLPPINN
uniref:Uncharacterized protein n=1 Tax=Panagrolaimus sp. PS1159 TaxID=55785 RepID=A0AC35ERQ4_9BILA